MYLICKGTITVLHFNMSSKYNFSIMLLGNYVTKALYPSHCEILCFYSKPFSDNLCTRDKMDLNHSYIFLFQAPWHVPLPCPSPICMQLFSSLNAAWLVGTWMH